MESHHRHLKLSDRIIISKMLEKSFNKDEIALRLKFYRSAIFREIKNRQFNGKCCSYKAHEDYLIKRKYCISYPNLDQKFLKYIKKFLVTRFFLDSVSGRLQSCKNKNYRISHQVIYNWTINGRLGNNLQKNLLFVRKVILSLNTLKNKVKSELINLQRQDLERKLAIFRQIQFMVKIKVLLWLLLLISIQSIF